MSPETTVFYEIGHVHDLVPGPMKYELCISCKIFIFHRSSDSGLTLTAVAYAGYDSRTGMELLVWRQ